MFVLISPVLQRGGFYQCVLSFNIARETPHPTLKHGLIDNEKLTDFRQVDRSLQWNRL